MTDYFAFFGLPPSPTLDRAALKRAYYRNSKRFHPDFHTLEDEQTQDRVLEQSTLNNQAYRTLSAEDSRLRHLLELRGALGEEGSNTVPQDFLLEIMEVNEALMELEFAEDPASARRVTTLIDELDAQLRRDVGDLIRNYDDETASEQDLHRLRDYYLKRRYLLRLRDKL